MQWQPWSGARHRWLPASPFQQVPNTPVHLSPQRPTGFRAVRCRATEQDLYAVLGVAYDADASAIKAAFRLKAKQLHPDVNRAADAEAAFRLLKRAHEVLSDSMLRAAHDSELRESLPAASAALRASDPRFARQVAGWQGVLVNMQGGIGRSAAQNPCFSSTMCDQACTRPSAVKTGSSAGGGRSCQT
jgi:hypothetical protein